MKTLLLTIAIVAGCVIGITCATVPTTKAAPKTVEKIIMTWHGLFVTNHTDNILVMPMFDIEVQRTLNLWKPALEKEGAVCNPDKVLLGTHVSIVAGKIDFKSKDKKTGKMKTEKVTGQITYGKRSFLHRPATPAKIIITFKADFQKSALGHELGHLFAYRCLDKNGNQALKELAEKYGLPY